MIDEPGPDQQDREVNHKKSSVALIKNTKENAVVEITRSR